MLENVFASLRPGGSFLVELNGKEVLARRYLPSSVDELPDGSVLIERRRIQDDWSRIHTDWFIMKDGKSETFGFQLTLYSGQELRDRLEQVGFVDVKLYGNMDGGPYNVDAARLIAVARKP